MADTFHTNTMIMVSLFATLAVVIGIASANLSFYPWGEKDHKQRNNDLLAVLRKNPGIETSEQTILEKFYNDSAILLTDSTENNWIIQIESSADSEISVDNIGGADDQDDDIFNLQAINKNLQNYCSVLPIDYWNYEWCHQKEIHQFHVEHRERGWVKEPNWSLGKYKRSVAIRDLELNPSPIVKLVDYYEDGQICHETNQYRSTEVHIICCDGMSVPNYTPSEVYFAHEPRSSLSTKKVVSHVKKDGTSTLTKAVFHNIQEPSTCSYVATICSPILCSRSQRGRSPEKQDLVNSDKSNLHKDSVANPPSPYPHYVTVMQEVINICLMKQEEWWTYEYCVGKGLRQIRFNIETITSVDGGVVQKSVPVNQYSLGVPQLEIFSSENALIQNTKFQTHVQHLPGQDQNSSDSVIINSLGMISPVFKSQEDEVNYFSFEYMNGTSCDLDNVNRSTIVELYCGNRNDFRLIREDSTCKYRIQVDLTALCVLPRFAPSTPKIGKLSVIAEDEFFQSMRKDIFQESSDTSAKDDYHIDRVNEVARDNELENLISSEPIHIVNSNEKMESLTNEEDSLWDALQVNEAVRLDSEVALTDVSQKNNDGETTIEVLSDFQEIFSDISISGEIILQENAENDDDAEDNNFK